MMNLIEENMFEMVTEQIEEDFGPHQVNMRRLVFSIDEAKKTASELGGMTYSDIIKEASKCYGDKQGIALDSY